MVGTRFIDFGSDGKFKLLFTPVCGSIPGPGRSVCPPADLLAALEAPLMDLAAALNLNSTWKEHLPQSTDTTSQSFKQRQNVLFHLFLILAPSSRSGTLFFFFLIRVALSNRKYRVLVFLILLHPFPSILQQFLNLLIFIYFWLHWVFAAARGLSLVAASGGYSSLWSTSFSLRWLLLLRSTGSRCVCFSSCGMQAQ